MIKNGGLQRNDKGNRLICEDLQHTIWILRQMANGEGLAEKERMNG